MALSRAGLEQELSATGQQVLGKLRSHQLFQSQWDTGAFVIFLIFLGACGWVSGWVSLPAQGPNWTQSCPTYRHRAAPAAARLHPLLLLQLL